MDSVSGYAHANDGGYGACAPDDATARVIASMHPTFFERRFGTLTCVVCGQALRCGSVLDMGMTLRSSCEAFWLFLCPQRHQGWEYDPVSGRWWLYTALHDEPCR